MFSALQSQNSITTCLVNIELKQHVKFAATTKTELKTNNSAVMTVWLCIATVTALWFSDIRSCHRELLYRTAKSILHGFQNYLQIKIWKELSAYVFTLWRPQSLLENVTKQTALWRSRSSPYRSRIKVVEKYKAGFGYKKLLISHGASLNPALENGKNIAQQQIYQRKTIHLNWWTGQGER